MNREKDNDNASSEPEMNHNKLDELMDDSDNDDNHDKKMTNVVTKDDNTTEEMLGFGGSLLNIRL